MTCSRHHAQQRQVKPLTTMRWPLMLLFLVIIATRSDLALAFTTPLIQYARFANRQNILQNWAEPTHNTFRNLDIPTLEATNGLNTSAQEESAIAVNSSEFYFGPQPPPTTKPPPRRISYRNLVPKARRPTIYGGSRYLSTDWILSLLSIPRSYLLRRIKSHVIFDQSVCLLVLLLHKAGKHISIPLLGHTLLGSFLGLLLAFRTNSAYDRFWDARGYWSKASAICRSLAIGCVWHLRPHAPRAVGRLEKLLVAFPDVLAYTCLLGVRKARLPLEEWELLYGEQLGAGDGSGGGSSGSGTTVKKGGVNVNGLKKTSSNNSMTSEHSKSKNKSTTTISSDEARETTNVIALDPATVILHKMHQCLHEASYESKNPPVIFNFYLSTMSSEVGQLSDALSGCEKIVQTPVPLSYSRHTSRFLTMWCGTLPFAIVKDLGWLSFPVMGIISWLLYGLEEIGHLIEQPFVPVTDRPSYLIDDGTEEEESQLKDDDRAAKTMPYDIGLPVCSVAERIRTEVENIVSLR